MEYFSFGILVLLRQLLLKFAALCGQTGDNPSHYRNRRACTHACDVGTGCKYWTGGVMYILVWCVILDRCVELDWCVVCTGLVCCMYWTGVLYVLDWCVVCTGLVCCMYWTGVLYVLDWCVVCTGLVCCMYWTGMFLYIHGFIYSLWLASELVGVGGEGRSHLKF